MNNIINELIALVLFGLLGAGYGLILASTLDTPIVYKSNSTGQCVAWEDKDGKHSCDTMPSTYDLVWVE